MGERQRLACRGLGRLGCARPALALLRADFIAAILQLGDGKIAASSYRYSLTVGVNLGVRRLATISDGTTFQSPKPLRRSLKRLAKLNRGLHRKVAGSSYRAKAAMRVAKCHARVVSVRIGALRELTTILACVYGRIVIEDLNVKGVIRGQKLSCAISDMGLGEFRRQLAYKVQPSLARLVVADQWFPSSKLCRLRGALNEGLILKDRTFECNGCGHVEVRDFNAACNLERSPGLHGNLYTC